MTTESQPKIFISYAHEDKVEALEIYDFLSRNGCNPWIDIYDLKPGQEWQLEIFQSITSSDYFIACLSSNSVSKRGYVQKELKFALEVLSQLPEEKIYIIPIRLDGCVVPHSLSNRQWTNWKDLPSREKILKSLGVRTESSENKYNIGLVLEFEKTMPYYTIQEFRKSVAYVVEEMKNQDIFSLTLLGNNSRVIIPATNLDHKESILAIVYSMEPLEAHPKGAELDSALQLSTRELLKHNESSISTIMIIIVASTRSQEQDTLFWAEVSKRYSIPIACIGVGDNWNEDLIIGISDVSVGGSAGSGAGSVYYAKTPEDTQNILRQLLFLPFTPINKF